MAAAGFGVTGFFVFLELWLMAPILEAFEVGLDSLCEGLEVAKPLMK